MQLILSKDNAKIMQEYKYTSLFNKKTSCFGFVLYNS